MPKILIEVSFVIIRAKCGVICDDYNARLIFTYDSARKELYGR